MEKRREDRRTNRTKRALRDSLVALILEKPYDSITVQDLIDRANVGRSTFYMHFRDKEDVLIGDWQRFLGFFMEHFDCANLDGGRLLPIAELFHHLRDFHPFYRALEKSRKSERLFRTGVGFMAERIEGELARRFADGRLKVPAAILADFLAREIFGQMRWWLDRHMPHSPEEMDRIFHALVLPGVRNCVDDGR